MLRGARVAMVLAAVVGALVVIGSGTGASRTRPAMAAAVDDLEGRFLTTRPSVGPTWVADLAGSGTAERMMLRTLQGLVNRRSAQLYLKDPGDSGASGGSMSTRAGVWSRWSTRSP